MTSLYDCVKAGKYVRDCVKMEKNLRDCVIGQPPPPGCASYKGFGRNKDALWTEIVKYVFLNDSSRGSAHALTKEKSSCKLFIVYLVKRLLT